MNWCRRENIGDEYITMFAKEEIFLEVVHELDEETLMQIGVSKAGEHRETDSSHSHSLLPFTP